MTMNCDLVICQSHPAYNFNTTSHTMVIVLESSMSMLTDRGSLLGAVQTVIGYFNQTTPNPIQNYAFTTFVAGGMLDS